MQALTLRDDPVKLKEKQKRYTILFSTDSGHFQTSHTLYLLLILVKIKKNIKRKSFFLSMGLSENIYNLVYTVNTYFIAIRVFNAHDSEAMQSMLPHHVSKVDL